MMIAGKTVVMIIATTTAARSSDSGLLRNAGLRAGVFLSPLRPLSWTLDVCFYLSSALRLSTFYFLAATLIEPMIPCSSVIALSGALLS